MAKSNDIYGLYCVCDDCVGETNIKYVGQTIEGARSRFNKHRHSARVGKPWPITRWMAKHGVDNIRFKVLETVESPADLDEAETRWISKLRTTEKGVGYNLWPGGNAARGYKHAPDAKSRRTGPKHSEETKKRIREAVAGRYGVESGNHKLTPEIILQIRWDFLNGYTHRALAKKYDTADTNVGAIVSGSSWPNVPSVQGPRRFASTGLFEPGTLPPNTKLNPEKVREIRSLGEQGLHPREIAERYGVTPENVSMILKRKTWKHIE